MSFNFTKRSSSSSYKFKFFEPMDFARMCVMAIHENRNLVGYFSVVLSDAPCEGEISDYDWLRRSAEEYAFNSDRSARSWTRNLSKLEELGWIEKRVMHDESGVPKLHVRITYEVFDALRYFHDLLSPYGHIKKLEATKQDLLFELRSKAQHRLKVNTGFKWYPPLGLVAPNAKIDDPFCVLPKSNQTDETI